MGCMYDDDVEFLVNRVGCRQQLGTGKAMFEFILPRGWLSLIVYSSTSSAFFLSFKGNILWTCTVEPVMSPSVVFFSFAKKGNYRSLLIFFSVIEDIVCIEIMK